MIFLSLPNFVDVLTYTGSLSCLKLLLYFISNVTSMFTIVAAAFGHPLLCVVREWGFHLELLLLKGMA